MKLRRIASSILVALLLVSMFGVMLVFAPPTIPSPPVVNDVFVTNTSDNPVPVDITDETIDVNLDEPIDVTLDEPIEVTNPADEALNVAIPDGVEITNFDEMPERALVCVH